MLVKPSSGLISGSSPRVIGAKAAVNWPTALSIEGPCVKIGMILMVKLV
jgi:hypothetical protein